MVITLAKTNGWRIWASRIPPSSRFRHLAPPTVKQVLGLNHCLTWTQVIDDNIRIQVHKQQRVLLCAVIQVHVENNKSRPVHIA